MTAKQKVAEVSRIAEKCRDDVSNLKLQRLHAVVEVRKELELLDEAIAKIAEIVR